MLLFRIAQGSQIIEIEPIIGTWYCGINRQVENGVEYEQTGTIARYAGAGEFYTEYNTAEAVDMQSFDFIMELL